MLPFQIPLPLTDPIVIFAVVSCLMLVVPFLMEKIRMPGLVGLLLAGAALGPNAFHVLERDESFVLFGNVGLIFIMFTAALEVDLSVFKKFGLHALVFGVLTFGLPQGLGTPAAHYLLQYDWPAAALMASIFASHTLLSYPVASRLGITKNRAVTTAVGGTMITDVAALMVLAVVAGTSTGEVNEAFWVRLGISLLVYVLVIFVGLPILGRFLFRRMGEDGVAQFSFVLASVFVCAALAHSAGVEPIVGAFFAGLALNRLIPHNGALMNRIQFTGEAIFVPFFLLSVGMLLDARVLFSGAHTWVLIGFMTGMVVVTKFVAAESTRLFLRFDKAEARVVFGLSVPQAAATLAAVMIGFELQLFDSAVVNATIVMILVTCTLGPWVTQRYGPAVAAREAALEAQAQVGPKQRILVGLQGLLNAQSVIEVGLMLRDGTHREPLHLVHAACDDESLTDTVARGENMLHDAVTLCSAADVPAKTATSVDHTVGEALVRSNKAVQSSHLLLDWDFAASDNPDSVLGTELDVLVAGVTSTLVLMRNRHPLGTNQKVTFAIPTGGVSAEELEAAAATVKRLANQLGAPVEVLAEQVTWDAIASVLEAAKPSAKLSHKLLESWASLNQALADLTSTSDLLVLMGTRDMDHEAARTPITVVERFPEASVFAIYGAVPEPLSLA
jgi:Kef-type K+ transport system membrane component KefB